MRIDCAQIEKVKGAVFEMISIVLTVTLSVLHAWYDTKRNFCVRILPVAEDLPVNSSYVSLCYSSRSSSQSFYEIWVRKVSIVSFGVMGYFHTQF
ncbi:hypothetical protein GEMRC1_008805 [Eukaryota sp. GEM-RC1]